MSEKNMIITVSEQLSDIADNLALVYASGFAAGRLSPIICELTDGRQLEISLISDLTTENGEIARILRGGELIWQKGGHA